mgnify:FL=1
MNKYHDCFNDHMGDWSINDRNIRVPLQKVIELLDGREPEQVEFENIAWKGMDISNNDVRYVVLDERYYTCDISYPGILVRGGLNPKKLKYRMIDGAHRMRKMLNETSKTSSLFFVLTNDEFMTLVENHGIQEKESRGMKYIEERKTEYHFGFPVTVYKFKKHEELKLGLLEESTEDLITESDNDSYYRTDRQTREILNRDLPNMEVLKNAYKEALKHFYYQVLGAVPDYQLVSETINKPLLTIPQITQSWVVHTKKIDDQSERRHMMMHTHWMSPVCGSYYLKKPLEIVGGNLLFENPLLSNDHSAISNTVLMIRDGLRCEGLQRTSMVEVEEGDIVLWTGVLPHTIEKIEDSSIERVSVIINSTPKNICRDAGGGYFYQLTDAH